ncbi:MAG: metallophosphoesterase [Chloroflexota bacterium]|nr:metallophosphoesterase [Chloroflexota bacterium]
MTPTTWPERRRSSRSLGRLGPARLAVLIASAALVASVAPAAAAGDPVLVGAGDIASCSSTGDTWTAKLLAGIPGTVFTAGDNVYPSGTASQYSRCYGPTWGRFKARTRPTPGNHEYQTAGASGYFGYFGSRAGARGKGWYAYNLGTWRIYALNSNCSKIGGCSAGSAQVRWLRADLRAHPRRCVLAYFHHPLFSSGPHGDHPQVKGLWDALYAYHAEVVISGHDHDYERFARMSPAGALDGKGIREFVVGTGGRSHYQINTVRAHSVVHNDDTFGVLKLTLRRASYDWRFIPRAGQRFTDSGTGTCR